MKAALFAALFITAAPTALAQDATERLRPLVGLTMAEFTRQTGLTPVDAYDANGLRYFTVFGNPVTMTYPGRFGAPSVTTTNVCKLLLETTRAKGTGAAAWRISSLTFWGPC